MNAEMNIRKLTVEPYIAIFVLIMTLLLHPIVTKAEGNAAYSDRDKAVRADNTGVNRRDRSIMQKTADQAQQNTNEVELAARIRQDIMKDKSLSTYAQNVKIIAYNGQVTIKGPVRSDIERQAVLKYARTAAGAQNVVNQVAVEPVRE